MQDDVREPGECAPHRPAHQSRTLPRHGRLGSNCGPERFVRVPSGFVSTVAEAIQAGFPTVKIHVEYRRANQVYEDVLGNVVDLGLVAYPNKDPRLEIVPLRKDRMVLVCHPQHPFAKLKTIPIASLTGQKFIGFEPDIPTRKAIDKIFRDHGVTVQTVMEFDNVETVKRAVEIDAGVSILPQTTIAQEVSKATLVQVPFEGELDDSSLHPFASTVHQPDFGQAGFDCRRDVFGDDRRHVLRGERVKVQCVFDGNPVGHAFW